MRSIVRLLRKRPFLIGLGLTLLVLLILVGGSRFGMSANTRLMATIGVLFAWILFLTIDRLKANRSAAFLEGSIREQAEEQILGSRPDKRKDIEVVRERMAEAIDSLKKSSLGKGRSGKSALYALPWYMFIGPPASGKTTAIVNSDLEFPFGTERIQGVGGTRNCDWFFSTSAILVDTAGRYTTEADDREEWLAFLDMLKKHRRRKPINGIIVGMNIADLLSAGLNDVEEHAKIIRGRIDEMIQRLEIRCPVYLIFTKCDLLQGFVEFFEDLSHRERDQIWGCTLTREQQNDPNPRAVFETEFSNLIDSLYDWRLSRLNDPMKREKKNQVYVFPLELSTAGENLAHFIGKLFQPNPYRESPIFRGFYFTSGTQEGVPIDRVIQSILNKFDLPSHLIDHFDPEMETKSYFIRDLFTDVIIPDQNMVELSTRAATRNRFVRVGATAGSLLALGLFVMAALQAFVRNERDLGIYEGCAGQVETVRWEPGTSLAESFEKLDNLRGLILELEEYESNKPILHLGMYRGDWVLAPLQKLYYRRAHAFVNRYLFKELETRLRDSVDRHSYPREQTLEYLKAYLLMSSEVARLDSTEGEFLAGVWDSILEDGLYQDPDNEYLPPLVGRQVPFFLQSLGFEGVLALEADGNLVVQTRNLIDEPLSIQYVYARLKQDGGDLQPFGLDQALHGRFPGMFQSDEAVAGVFTRSGWDMYFREAIERESANPGKDSWVTGHEDRPLPLDMRDSEVMAEALSRLYFKEYADAWWDFLRRIRYEPFGSIQVASRRLQQLGNVVESPLVLLLDAVTYQTRFESPIAAEPENRSRGVIDDIKGRIGLEAGAGERAPKRVRYPVDEEFASIHRLSDATDPQQGVVGVLKNYFALHQALESMRDEPGSGARDVAGLVVRRKTGAIPDALTAIANSMSALDPTVREELFEQPVRLAWEAVLGEAQKYVNERWNERVYGYYRENIAGYYPFKKASPREIPIIDMERFFQKDNGVFWKFFDEELSQFVRRDSWRPYTWEKRGLRLSSQAVSAFRHADQITEGLFAGGSLRVDFSLQPDLPISSPGMLQDVEQVYMSIDGQEDSYQMGMPRWKSYTWPGDFGVPGARLEVSTTTGSYDPMVFDGEWAWFRMLDRASIQMQTTSMFELQWPFPWEGDWEIRVKYKLRSSSSTNPFGKLDRFFGFRCPRQLYP